MLDTATLRVCFALIGLTLVVLFYLAAYRPTRSAYSGWWCVSLLLFLVSSALYLLDGTVHQVWANPCGNAAALLGAGSVWAAARSLRTRRPPWWQLAAVPVVVLVASFLDDPATNEWSGGALFLPGMALLLGLAGLDLHRFHREIRGVGAAPTLGAVVLTMTVTSVGTSVFYLGRSVAFWLVGPDHPGFTRVFGSVPTTLLLIVLLATVSFSMSSLSNEQRRSDLEARATRDGLTGLLNRVEFLRLADLELRRMHREQRSGALVVADLDHFKRVNDELGHAAGDGVLRGFAEACLHAVRAEDLVCRWGGEEFVLLLPGVTAARAEEITVMVSRRLSETVGPDTLARPTASYGIAVIDPVSRPGVPLEDHVDAADAAMYQAKAAGRDRAAHAHHVG